MNEIIEQYESNVRSYCRKWPATFQTSKGPFIYGEDGTRYIDFFDGAGTLNFGHNNDYIKDALISYLQADGVLHGLDTTTSAKVAFIKTFEERILAQSNVEGILTAKGFTSVLCYATDSGCTVSVLKQDMKDDSAMIIKDAVLSQMKVEFNNIVIVEV